MSLALNPDMKSQIPVIEERRPELYGAPSPFGAYEVSHSPRVLKTHEERLNAAVSYKNPFDADQKRRLIQLRQKEITQIADGCMVKIVFEPVSAGVFIYKDGSYTSKIYLEAQSEASEVYFRMCEASFFKSRDKVSEKVSIVGTSAISKIAVRPASEDDFKTLFTQISPGELILNPEDATSRIHRSYLDLREKCYVIENLTLTFCY